MSQVTLPPPAVRNHASNDTRGVFSSISSHREAPLPKHAIVMLNGAQVPAARHAHGPTATTDLAGLTTPAYRELTMASRPQTDWRPVPKDITEPASTRLTGPASLFGNHPSERRLSNGSAPHAVCSVAVRRGLFNQTAG
jgi:hypothetical protein